MPTRIQQIDDADRAITTLRVEGEMLGADASLLEKIALDIRSTTRSAVVIDLADLDFLDSDAASVLRRIQLIEGFSLIGMEIFLQNVINEAERHTV